MKRAKPARIELHAPPPRFMRRQDITPPNMQRIKVEPEVVAAMQRVVLGIFADMSNAERSFLDILLAVYISGIEHALEVSGAGRSRPDG